MWYFTWILGIGVALGFGIINLMWLEATGKFAPDPQHAGTPPATPEEPPSEPPPAKKLIAPLMQASATPFCLLDKDTLFGGYSAAAMAMLTGDPNDRDSPLFLQHLRDPEYRGLLDTARDNLELGVSALVVGPLSREVRERRLFDRAWLGVGADVALRVLWVHTSQETALQQILH